MQAAKDAVKSFTNKHGHRTEVDETVHPSVTSETVKPHQHQQTTQAVDKEVHQHHYHTTVQPLEHQERLPEKHVHQALPTEHREIHHEDNTQTKAKVEAELAKFKPTSKTVETTASASTAPTVAGEHVHHHVHENVVPVVHKSTVQPEVVHTTQPIHETHHAPSQHHGISQLPMKTLDEFKSAGGVLTGGSHAAGGEKTHRHEEYDGCPRPYNDKLSTTFDKLGVGHHGNESSQGHRTQDSGVGFGQTASSGNATDGLAPGHSGNVVSGSGVGSGKTGAGGRDGLTGGHTETGTGIGSGGGSGLRTGERLAERVDDGRGVGHTGNNGQGGLSHGVGTGGRS